MPSDVRHMLARRFADAGIPIAFPRRDVRLGTTGAIRVELPGGGDASESVTASAAQDGGTTPVGVT